MIDFIFTLDYEIYGDGTGSLKECVLEPARSLFSLFQKRAARFVVFVEAAEIEVIHRQKADPAIAAVIEQVKEFYGHGYEIGLHLHPQWYNAKLDNSGWILDRSEYNLCLLSEERVRQVVDRSISFLKRVLDYDYSPISFRAGNWLFQPTRTAAKVLYDFGLRVDSSVFKGGVLPEHGVDYRPALRNGWFWRFTEEVNVPEPKGFLLEIPIYTRMVPFWKMVTFKRLAAHQRPASYAAPAKGRLPVGFTKAFSGLKYPEKLDFCRMTRKEIKSMLERLIREDKFSPSDYRPIVAIGHTKDLTEIRSIDYLINFLIDKGILITDFRSAYAKCLKA